MWLPNGSIFVGDFQRNKMNEGQLYEMQQDKTCNLYQVKYDSEKDAQNKITPYN